MTYRNTENMILGSEGLQDKDIAKIPQLYTSSLLSYLYNGNGDEAYKNAIEEELNKRVALGEDIRPFLQRRFEEQNMGGADYARKYGDGVHAPYPLPKQQDDRSVAEYVWDGIKDTINDGVHYATGMHPGQINEVYLDPIRKHWRDAKAAIHENDNINVDIGNNAGETRGWDWNASDRVNLSPVFDDRMSEMYSNPASEELYNKYKNSSFPGYARSI